MPGAAALVLAMHMVPRPPLNLMQPGHHSMHHHQARLIKDCLRSFSLVERRGLARLVILGLVSMLSRYMTAKTLESKRLVEMLRIDFMRQDLPCMYLAHHEPKAYHCH